MSMCLLVHLSLLEFLPQSLSAPIPKSFLVVFDKADVHSCPSILKMLVAELPNLALVLLLLTSQHSVLSKEVRGGKLPPSTLRRNIDKSNCGIDTLLSRLGILLEDPLVVFRLLLERWQIPCDHNKHILLVEVFRIGPRDQNPYGFFPRVLVFLLVFVWAICD